MKTSILEARTVAIVKPLTVEQRTGANGTFEAKTILVRIAVDRDYKMTRTENGKAITEYPTDFWLAKFTGAVAQAFADNCTMAKEDGKLVSRHLLLNGSFENYTNTRKQHVAVQPQVNINGQIYQLNLELDVDIPNNSNTIFVVDSMRFLDKKPETAQPNNAATVASVTPASATPIGIAPQAPVAAPVAPIAPVQQAAPVAQPVAAAAPVAQPVSASIPVDMSGAMNAPVVGEGFAPGGYTCPF